MTTESKRRRRLRPIDFGPVVLLFTAAFASVSDSHHESVPLIWINFLLLAAAYTWAIVLQAQKKEFDRLVFYKSTTLTFCVTLGGMLLYGLLLDLGAVSTVRPSLVAQCVFTVWIVATSVFRSTGA